VYYDPDVTFSYAFFYAYNGGTEATGQYFLIKYHAESNAGYLQVYTSTEKESPRKHLRVDLFNFDNPVDDEVSLTLILILWDLPTITPR
jgi:hypothetical protein